MKRFLSRSLVLASLLLPLSAHAESPAPTLPVDTKGTLVIFEVEDLRCALYVNEQGMAGGAGTPSCVRMTYADKDYAREFRLLRVIKTKPSSSEED